MKINRLLTILALFLTLCCGSAQTYEGSLFITELQQQSLVNPSYSPRDSGVHIALPSVSFQLDHTGPALQDISRKQVGRRLVNLGVLADVMKADFETLSVDLSLQSLLVGYKFDGFYLQIGQMIKTESDLIYSRDMARLLWNGNGPLLGETLQLDTDVNVVNYSEIFLTASKEIGRLRVGVSLKYLNGLSYLRTESSQIRVTTRETDLALEIDNDFSLINAGVLDYRGISDVNWDGDFLQFTDVLKHNSGFAFDLGISFTPNENSLVGLSIRDIGKITWNTDIERIRSTASRSYEGLQLSDILAIDQINLTSITDSVEQVLDISQESLTDYESQLTKKYTLHGHTGIGLRWTVGAAAVYLDRDLRSDLQGHAWLNYKAASWIEVGASISYRYENIANIGLLTKMTLGPASFFVQTYHLPGAVNIIGTDHFSIMTGLNLHF